MGRKPWTTQSEKEWLTPRIPAFLQAQERGSTKEFYTQLHEDWWKAFPLEEPPEADKSEAERSEAERSEAEGSVAERSEAEKSEAEKKAQAMREHIKKQELVSALKILAKHDSLTSCSQRLDQWYHNHTRPTQSSSKEAVIPVKKTSKAPALWQAYSTLYYQSKLKALVDEAWFSYLKTKKESEIPLDAESGSAVANSASRKEKKLKTRIQVHNEVIQAEFKKETPQVKAEVEAYVKDLKEKKSKSPEAEDNTSLLEKYQR